MFFVIPKVTFSWNFGWIGHHKEYRTKDYLLGDFIHSSHRRADLQL